MTIDQLWVDYKENNSKESKDELIINYVSLVKIIAGRLFVTYNAHIEYDDLLGYGIIGLIDAIGKFDPSKSIKFETYANIRIRGAIVDQIRQMDWIPRSIRQKYKQIEDTIKNLELELGENIADDIIAEKLGLTLNDYQKLLGEVSTYSVMSLEEKIESNSNFDLKSKNIEFQPEEKFESKEMENILSGVIEKLPEKEKVVLQLYYYSEFTYKEIAKVLLISESRVSQIHTKAITKLKISLNDLY